MTKSVLRVALITIAILMVPAIAMQFSDDMDWGPGDFLVLGALLFGTGLLYVLITERLASRGSRIAVGAGLAVALLTVCAELAVGIFN
ncbi:MAG: hypothetical protein V4601_13930 [Pseudomonadota bacterium]